MKLIDILVQKLPKHGGWPSEAAAFMQDGYGCVFYRPKNNLKMAIDTRKKFILAEDYSTCEVTREQYEAALKQSVWDGTGLPPVGVECEVSVDGGRTWCSYKAINERNGVRLIEVGNFTEEFMVNNWAFRPIRTERDEAVHTIADLCRSAASNGHSADLIYNAIAEGKIPGIKLEKE